MKKIQLNLSTTATLGTEESDHCKEVLNKRQCMDFFVEKDQKKVVVVERWLIAEV